MLDIDTIATVSLTVGATVLFYEVGRLVRGMYIAHRTGKRTYPVSQIGSGGPTILIIGDSTAYGTGASTPQHSLVGRLAQSHPEVTIINLSENAMDVARLSEVLLGLTGIRIDIACIHIGGMDALHFTSRKTIEQCLRKSVERLRALGAKRVMLVSMNNVGNAPLFRFPLSSLFTWRSRMLTRHFEDLCREHSVIHIPLFRDNSIDPLLHKHGHYFSDDLIHPNDTGYGFWYNTIHESLIPHLNSENPSSGRTGGRS